MNSVSVTGKKWFFKKFNPETTSYIKENHYLDEITSKLIAIKDIKKENLNNFLDPSIKNILPNPSILLDLEKTCERTVKAILNNEIVGIFGDYDVDGAASTAILGRYFSQINTKFHTYIPDRKLEGYGPNINGFDKLIKNGVTIIFTVDCGTLSYGPIEYAFKQKIDVLVLDHHQSEIKLPKAFSIINPNRLDDKSGLNYLCASGVCFMFLIGLNRALRKKNYFKDNNINEPDLIQFLDLVSLGTVCDVVPLISLNRAFVKQGLKILKRKKNIGLKTLLDICKVEIDPTTYHLGFVLGPRINAGGRVGKCSHGAELLLNKETKKTFKLASELNTFNLERQTLEKKLLDEIIKSIKNNIDPIIVLSGENWHEGIIGIIASRIKDRFNKPTIIISLNKNIGKASARSIIGYDIGSVILAAFQKGILKKGGGHKMAGGFTIKKEMIDSFKMFAIDRFNSLKMKTNEEQKIYIDSLIAPSALNIDFFNKVNILSPFGSGNSEPKFTIENVKLISAKIVGEKHIKSILLSKCGLTIKSIAFNVTDNEIGAYLLKKTNKYFNIVGKLSLNQWRGQKNVEFIIDDISVNKNHENVVPSSIG